MAHYKPLEKPAFDGSTKMAIARDLKPYTSYAIRVIPVNIKGYPRNTIPKILKTTPGEPSSPKHLTVSVLNSTTLLARWEPPLELNGVIEQYRLFCSSRGRQSNDGASVAVKNFYGRLLTREIPGLRKYARYDLSVKTVNEWNGEELVGPPSSIVQVTTDEDAPSKPVNVRMETITDSASTLRVSWNEPLEPNGIIRKYAVFYQPKLSVGSSEMKAVGGDQKEMVIDGLVNYTPYVVQVQAHTVKAGPMSNQVEGTTDQGLPSAPQSLTIVTKSKTTVTLQWKEPAIPRGILTEYRLYWKGKKIYNAEEKGIGIVDVDNFILIRSTLNEETIDSLVPDTAWTFYITAFTSKGQGDASASVNVKTLPDAPSPPSLSTENQNATYGTIQIELKRPSDRNGPISRIDLLVAPLEKENSLDSVNFTAAEANVYSPNLPFGSVYIAASFPYHSIKSSFTFGDSSECGGYVNGPLKPDSKYAYALRAYTETAASQTELVSVSKSLEAFTLVKDGKTRIIVGVAIIMGLIAIYLIYRNREEIAFFGLLLLLSAFFAIYIKRQQKIQRRTSEKEMSNQRYEDVPSDRQGKDTSIPSSPKDFDMVL
eukprot:m.143387 g.143387  ORF g.143387 m.143387 type:complete len:597 (+) comp38385_c0_seq2:1159-2949(+)